MVDGVEVTGYVLLPDDAKKLCRLLRLQTMCLASRMAMRAHTHKEWKEAVDKHFDEPSFVVMKRLKRVRER